MLDYKTGKLPPQMTALGVFLFAIGIWRMFLLEWIGVVLFVLSLLLIFVRFGVLIDSNKKQYKKYISFFTLKKGDWEDISTLKNLLIARTKATQSMNVLSINRTQQDKLYRLFLVLPNKKISLMSNEKDFILLAAEEIASKLETTIVNNVK